MELSLSGWVTLACGVLIVAVLGHAFWLRWRTQRNRLRIEIDPAPVPTSGADDLELLRGELPNGGARVIRGQSDPAVKRSENRPPVLLDTVRQDYDDPALANPAAASELAAATGVNVDTPASAELSVRRPDREARPQRAPELEAERARQQIDKQIDKQHIDRTHDENQAAEKPHSQHEELFVMQVLCRDSNGFELVQLMARATQAGMKFGDFNIFHRYKDAKAGRNRIEYSMANAVEPGAFDLSAPDARTRGVAFFMRLPLTTGSEPVRVFEDMLKAVQNIAHHLDAEIRDERQGVLTAQTIEHCRERIHEFARRQQIRG